MPRWDPRFDSIASTTGNRTMSTLLVFIEKSHVWLLPRSQGRARA
jgi:hypothetical protein